MCKIKVSLDREALWSKPQGKEIAVINNRIGSEVKAFDLNSDGMQKFAESVGIDGHTFCTATFSAGKRNKDSFQQQQIFALDFDNKDLETAISLKEVKTRADYYGLPILFAYDTFSSTNHDKFRVVFLNDISISHRKVAEAVQLAIGTIFPEADSSCYRDISRMYFGGKGLLYYDDSIPTINAESVFRHLTYYLEDRHKHKLDRCKKDLAKFSRESGIALNKKGFLDVTVTDDPTESLGANQSNQNGKISPSPIIYNGYNIIANGEIYPNKYYCIRLTDSTNSSSVATAVSKTAVATKQYKNRGVYRSCVLSDMSQGCQLFREFETGERDMRHDELFGLASNLLQVETGIKHFREVQLKFPKLYDDERREKWNRHISYIRQQEYKPSNCNSFCPYSKECNHSTNILSTAHPKRRMMERIPGYQELFDSIEAVQEDTYLAISRAYHTKGNGIHVIKSMTGAGKSYSYLKIMSENPEDRFLIAVPTNLLKDEIYNKARKRELDIRKTPSLDEIKGEMPQKVWKHIQQLRNAGKHRSVHPYIQKILEKNNIPCLRKYLQEREALMNFGGTVITTHRYLLSMDEDRLKEYDVVIIDEDIIFKSIIPNQGEVTTSELRKQLKHVTDIRLRDKIRSLLRQSKECSCIELDGFEWDDEDDENDRLYSFDLPSFCQAERFYVRRASKEKGLSEDTIVFLKHASFKNVKYIIVSDTVDENICRKYFNKDGEDKVKFYECKRAAYMGTLHQYPDRSMSRSSIANDPGIVRRLMKRFNMSEDCVITFMRENIGHLHFGNTEGSNTIEGKDILVVGTPYHADFLYKLAAFEMGTDFDEDEEMEPQEVTHNGYRFRFTTFKDKELQAIQLWMIESELEQAVGRARLLRNSCKVHLFSNFPLSQAQMIDNFDYSKE